MKIRKNRKKYPKPEQKYTAWILEVVASKNIFDIDVYEGEVVVDTESRLFVVYKWLETNMLVMFH